MVALIVMCDRVVAQPDRSPWDYAVVRQPVRLAQIVDEYLENRRTQSCHSVSQSRLTFDSAKSHYYYRRDVDSSLCGFQVDNAQT